jgi:hypothetical protein
MRRLRNGAYQERTARCSITACRTSLVSEKANGVQGAVPGGGRHGGRMVLLAKLPDAMPEPIKKVRRAPAGAPVHDATLARVAHYIESCSGFILVAAPRLNHHLAIRRCWSRYAHDLVLDVRNDGPVLSLRHSNGGHCHRWRPECCCRATHV